MSEFRRRLMMAAVQGGEIPKVRHTVTFIPSSYDTENYSWESAQNISNGYTHSTSTTLAKFGIPMKGTAYVYYKFDTSSIPDGADIISVSCDAKLGINGNSTTTPEKKVQMFTGTTAKGSAVNVSSTASIKTMNDATWTLAEVRDIRVRPYARCNTTAQYYISFYGADLTIVYEV